jgi:hypothetical protein
MRLAVMPRTRERSEWSGHGVDGQTAPAKTAPQAAGAKTRSRTESTVPNRSVNGPAQGATEGVTGHLPLEWVAPHEVGARERLFPPKKVW